jgi:hypothetical protein
VSSQPGIVAHACHPSYSGGGSRSLESSRPVWEKSIICYLKSNSKQKVWKCGSGGSLLSRLNSGLNPQYWTHAVIIIITVIFLGSWRQERGSGGSAPGCLTPMSLLVLGVGRGPGVDEMGGEGLRRRKGLLPSHPSFPMPFSLAWRLTVSHIDGKNK